MKTVIIILIILIIAVAGIVIYDITHFVTRKYVLSTKISDIDAKLVFLSDLHGYRFGKDNEKLIKAIDDLKPDAVLIGGDMITASPSHPMERTFCLCQALKDKGYPVYYANGNHEYRAGLYPEQYGNMSLILEEGLQKAGVIRLIDKTEKFVLKSGGCLFLSGLQIDRTYYKRFHSVKMPETYVKEHLGDAVGDEGYQIVMAHDPDHFDAYRKYGSPLFLSGHVHGGIARLPLIGGVISTRFKLFPKYDGGRFDENGTTMIVSRGLGTHTIPVRFLNPCELVYIEIKSEISK